jgi:hypothetical protein
MSIRIFGREENFRTRIEDEVKGLYEKVLKGEYHAISKRQMNRLVKKNKYGIGKIVVSLAGDYLRGTEDRPDPADHTLIKIPHLKIEPGGTDYYILKKVLEGKKLIDEKNLTQEERTIKSVCIPAYELIRDEQGYLKREIEKRKLSPKNPAKCNSRIVKMVKYLESEMDFPYGSDWDNFKYEELALTPTQAYVLKNSKMGIFEKVEMDCEDMHLFGATCFKVAGMDERYRLVRLEKHLGLCVIGDSFEDLFVVELTPENVNLSGLRSIRDLPRYGGDHSLPVKPEKVILSYDHKGYYGSLKVFGERRPLPKEWIREKINLENEELRQRLRELLPKNI